VIGERERARERTESQNPKLQACGVCWRGVMWNRWEQRQAMTRTAMSLRTCNISSVAWRGISATRAWRTLCSCNQVERKKSTLNWTAYAMPCQACGAGPLLNQLGIAAGKLDILDDKNTASRRCAMPYNSMNLVLCFGWQSYAYTCCMYAATIPTQLGCCHECWALTCFLLPMLSALISLLDSPSTSLPQ
jgi:hypothetical protein